MDLTEKLITLVQQYPCLYDCRVKNYKNIAQKERVWEQIANELEQSSDVIRTKWKNLKDGYGKYKKSLSGNCTSKVSKYGNWVWGPYLNFLDGAIHVRNKTNDATTDNPNAVEVNAELLSTYKSEENSGDVDPSLNAANDSSIQEFLQLSTSRLTRKRKGSNHGEEFYSNLDVKDSIDLLFESYAKSLKHMKPRTQAAIKIKLAQIFADAELDELQQSEVQNVVPVQCNQNAVYSVLSTINDNETYSANSTYDDVKKE